MNILHTSDWHLGHSLYGRRRYGEFQAFLSWLLELIRRENVEVLLLAGDVFDSALPGTQAQALYYGFLRDVSAPDSPCRHVVVISGNHDSPTFLDAPGGLLSAMHIHVVGRAREPEEECLLLNGADGSPALVACAVPFLRDRDLYRASDGDGADERDARMAEGMKEHYRRAALEAERLRAGRDIPVLAMGHLFAAGGQAFGDDGVRDLRVGSLGQVSADVFPPLFDYVALGHLHSAQKVHGEERLRYAGSPLPMGFDEAARPREVRLLSTKGRNVSSRGVAVPSFQRLERVEGSLADIEKALRKLSQEKESVWAEVVHTGSEPVADLRERVEDMARGPLEILRVRNLRVLPEGMEADPEQETLEELGVEDVFERKLKDAFPERAKDDPALEDLRVLFREAVAAAREKEQSCAS